MLTSFVAAEYITLGLFYLFIEPKTETLLTYYFVIGLVASILYVAFIPESPFWLIVNEG